MGTHKILKDGTSYAIKGGTDLIAGTSYQIGGGRTLVNGTAFEIKFSDGLTWVINKSPKTAKLYQEIGFTSNGKIFYAFGIAGEPKATITYYSKTEGTWYACFNGKWEQETFRTVTFDEPPTGKLLTWLQANAVQQ